MWFTGKFLSALAMAMLLSSSTASLLRDKYRNSSGSQRSSSSSSSTSVSSSSDSSSSSNSSSSSHSSSSSSSRSSSSSKSSSKSSSGSSSSSESTSSEEEKLEEATMLSRCNRKDHIAFVFNLPISKRLGYFAAGLEANNIKAAFVVDGVQLNSSLDWRAKKQRPLVERLVELGHTLIVKPHIDDNVPFRKLCKQKALLAVQTSAVQIEQVIGVHPRLVHIPGRKVEEEVLLYLAEYQYFVVDWSDNVSSKGDDLKKLRRHRSSSHSNKKKKSSKNKRSKSKKNSKNKNSKKDHQHGSSRNKSDRKNRNYKVKVQEKTAKGHIFYGHDGKNLIKNTEAILETAWKRRYEIVSFEACVPGAEPYREV